MKDLESQISEMTAEIHALTATVEVLENDNKNGNEKIKTLQHQLNQKVMELNEVHSYQKIRLFFYYYQKKITEKYLCGNDQERSFQQQKGDRFVPT